MLHITTLGQLKKSGYQSKSIKEEVRENLIAKLKNNENVFTGILGYEDSVIPDVERALLWVAWPGQNKNGKIDDRFTG
jgi:magnesium chelatase subunit I